MLRMTILRLIAGAMGLDLAIEVPVAKAANGGPTRPNPDDNPSVRMDGLPVTIHARQGRADGVDEAAQAPDLELT